jgi:hypothetical protein
VSAPGEEKNGAAGKHFFWVTMGNIGKPHINKWPGIQFYILKDFMIFCAPSNQLYHK